MAGLKFIVETFTGTHPHYDHVSRHIHIHHVALALCHAKARHGLFHTSLRGECANHTPECERPGLHVSLHHGIEPLLSFRCFACLGVPVYEAIEGHMSRLDAVVVLHHLHPPLRIVMRTYLATDVDQYGEDVDAGCATVAQDARIALRRSREVTAVVTILQLGEKITHWAPMGPGISLWRTRAITGVCYVRTWSDPRLCQVDEGVLDIEDERLFFIVMLARAQQTRGLDPGSLPATQGMKDLVNTWPVLFVDQHVPRS
mmetsp:Transcript_122925/g.244516  ORF Transcript_122925/g.244516 Transcript_122925/m.244516 type:complete len:258 (+) Transcript_122925:626-1399(+)